MIPKQLLLLGALIVAGLFVVYGLDLNDEQSEPVSSLDSRSGDALGSAAQIDPSWASTDLSRQGGSFGSASSVFNTAQRQGSSAPLVGESRVGSNGSTSNSTQGASRSGLPGASQGYDAGAAQSTDQWTSPSAGQFGSVAQRDANTNTNFSVNSNANANANDGDQQQSDASGDNGDNGADAQEPEPEPAFASEIQISGHVSTSAGEAVTGMPVSLQLVNAIPDDMALFGKSKRAATTDASGYYQFLNLVEGTYMVCAGAVQGYGRVCQRPRAPLTSADFKLKKGVKGQQAQISGTVVNDQGQAIDQVKVSVAPGNPGHKLSNKEGQYKLALSVVASKKYHLTLSKSGYSSARFNVQGQAILDGEYADFSVVLRTLEGVTVTGVVRDANGNSLQGQRVQLSSKTAKQTHALMGSSNEYGAFSIKNVTPASDYTVYVRPGKGYSFDRSSMGEIEVFYAMPDIEITLKPIGLGAIGVKVLDSQNSPVANVPHRISYNGRHNGNATTDQSGYMHFADVSATQGKSALRIVSQGYPQYIFSGITLNSGEEKTDLVAKIDKGDHTLTVVVRDENYNVLPGIDAILTWSHNGDGITSKTVRSKGKVSKSDGTINFSELGPGMHHLTVRKRGSQFEDVRMNVDVGYGQQQVEVTMKEK